jgi:glucosamine-6-phosphate deaminase
MKLIIEKDYEDMSKRAAEIIAKELREKPNMVLGLATGSTPIGTYKELIRMHREDGLDFSEASSFNLDEYYRIAPSNSQSYHYFMEENLFKNINLPKERIHIPDSMAEDISAFCKEYDNEIMEYGGIDLQILGIGENGHIAFNEPSDELFLGTHLTDLTSSTIQVNSRFFSSIEEVPTKAVTMGIGSIMKAKKILLLANGKKKSKIIKDMLLNDTITTQMPASMLLLHPNVTIILDSEAAHDFLEESETI